MGHSCVIQVFDFLPYWGCCWLLTSLCCTAGWWCWERGHQDLPGHLSATLSWRGVRVGGRIATCYSWASCLGGWLRSQPICDACLGELVLGEFPSLWEDPVLAGHGWAQAGPPRVLALRWFPALGLRQPQLSQLLPSLLTFTPSSCFWSHPNCRHDQPHPHPVCLDIPTFGSLLLGWLSLFHGGTQEGKGSDDGSHTAWTGALLPWLTHPRGEDFWGQE